MTERFSLSNGLPKPTQASNSPIGTEATSIASLQPESAAQDLGGRPRLEREKVWELSKQKRCWYCGTPCEMEADKCPKCRKGRFEPWGITEIAKFLKMSRSTVYRAIEEMPKDYKPEVVEFVLPTDLESCESIQNWKRGIQLSGHLSAFKNLPVFKKICQGVILQGFKCHPDKFDLEKMQQFVSAYLEEKKVKKLPRQFRMAMRSFLASRGMAIPRGAGSQYGVSGEKDSYGEYGHIKLSDDQIDQMRDYLSDNLEALFFFDYGIETCARAQTIVNTEISKIEKTNGLIQIRVLESKTQKQWTKYLLTTKYSHAKDTAQELEAYTKAHPQRRLLFLDEGQTYREFEQKICKKLKEAYEAIGVTDPYFYKKPIHSLRHIGAHLWLRRTKYDYVLVAKIGGWEDVQTLIDCYGEMTADVVLQKILELERAD